MADAAQALGFRDHDRLHGRDLAGDGAGDAAGASRPASSISTVPLLLARDRDGGLRYDGSLVYPPEAALWG